MSDPANKIVFISDVHMGNDTKLSWFQPGVHGALLGAMLDYISQTLGNQVLDVVFAGDLVDQWVVDPADPPPTFSQLVAAHASVFGGDTLHGQLQQILQSISGNVYYLNGNHDGFITEDDIATLPGGGGKRVQYVKGGVYLNTAWGAPILAKHGHQYSVFNAPDLHDDPPNPSEHRHGGLALGHFITRLCSRWVKHWVEQPDHKGYTAANLPSPGAPFGIQGDMPAAIAAVAEILYDVIEKKPVDPAQIILDALSVDALMDPDEDTISLFPGYKPLTPREAAAMYTDLLSYWDQTYGDEVTANAIVKTDMASDLGWTIPSMTGDPRVVVMGHTHQWAESESDGPVTKLPTRLYANSGFGCPTLPQMNADEPSFPSFVELTHDASQATYEVTVNEVRPTKSVPEVVPLQTETISAK